MSGPHGPEGTGPEESGGAAGPTGRIRSREETGRSAVSVGGGILASRVTGFLRDLAIAGFFGTGLAADAFTAALKIPNLIRNLLGEGTLSASFVPVYSAMLGEGEGREAEGPGRLARAMLGAMIVAAALLSALGVLTAPVLIPLIAPGFGDEATRLTTELVRILFPMAGVFMLAAWALGVLNSHRRFFLPFAAPVAWNLCQVAGLLVGARLGWEPLVHVLAWSALLGAVLQFGVQLPSVYRLVRTLRPRFEWNWEPLRRVVRNMGPVAAGQGVYQVASLADVFLASLLAQGAVAGLYYSQRLVYLPISLFGISVAASSLPEMSRAAGGGADGSGALRRRLANGFFEILFFVFPSAVALILFGDLAVQVLFQRGEFGADSTAFVAAIIVAYSLGLVANSSVKLFASGFHAMQDTRTPMKYAAAGVGTGVACSAALMWPFGVPGLALGSAVGAWINASLLWRGLERRLGPLLGPRALRATARLGAACVAGAAAGVLARGELERWIGSSGTVEALIVLAGTLVAAGVPYLLIARKPPAVADVDGSDGDAGGPSTGGDGASPATDPPPPSADEQRRRDEPG